MSTYTVGRFMFEVSELGYPYWVRLTSEGHVTVLGGPNVTISMHHDELCDLHYAVEKAIRQVDAAKAEAERIQGL